MGFWDVANAVTGAASHGVNTYDALQERERKRAALQVQALDDAAQRMIASGNNASAVSILPQRMAAFNKANQTSLAGPGIVGDPSKDAAERFSSPGTTASLMGVFGQPANAKPIELSPGATAYDPITQKPLYTAPNHNRMTAEQQIEIARQKLEMQMALKRMGVDAQTATALMRLAHQGGQDSFSPITLDDGTIAAMSRRTGGIKPTGAKAKPKAAEVKPIFKDIQLDGKNFVHRWDPANQQWVNTGQMSASQPKQGPRFGREDAAIDPNAAAVEEFFKHAAPPPVKK